MCEILSRSMPEFVSVDFCQCLFKLDTLDKFRIGIFAMILPRRQWGGGRYICIITVKESQPVSDPVDIWWKQVHLCCFREMNTFGCWGWGTIFKGTRRKQVPRYDLYSSKWIRHEILTFGRRLETSNDLEKSLNKEIL